MSGIKGHQGLVNIDILAGNGLKESSLQIHLSERKNEGSANRWLRPCILAYGAANIYDAHATKQHLSLYTFEPQPTNFTDPIRISDATNPLFHPIYHQRLNQYYRCLFFCEVLGSARVLPMAMQKPSGPSVAARVCSCSLSFVFSSFVDQIGNSYLAIWYGILLAF